MGKNKDIYLRIHIEGLFGSFWEKNLNDYCRERKEDRKNKGKSDCTPKNRLHLTILTVKIV